MDKAELGKWYKYQTFAVDKVGIWHMIPLHIYEYASDRFVLSIDVQASDFSNIRVEIGGESWYEDHLVLSKDPPSFQDIALSDGQKTKIFKIIFGETL